MNQMLNHIFSFLKENRQYNDELQRYELQKAMHGAETPTEKVHSLLHGIYETQVNPNLNRRAAFFDELVVQGELNSYQDLVKGVSNIANADSKSLFISLKQCNGWGHKTAALFTKSLYLIHTRWDNELAIWTDVPVEDMKTQLMLPVDAVILHIFKTANEQRGINHKTNWTFSSINAEVKNEENDLEVWDHLWFWGFISQKTKNGKRVNEYNPEKLKSLYTYAPHQKPDYQKIEDLSKKFISLLDSSNAQLRTNNQ